MKLSFDEYGNSMRAGKGFNYGISQERHFQKSFQKHDPREYILHDPDNMPGFRFKRPYGESVDIATTASTILTFLRHADRVEIGCMTGGLAAYAACDHDHVWKSGLHYFFQQLKTYGTGVSMRTGVDCDTFDAPAYATDNFHMYDMREGLPFIESAAAYDEDKGTLTVFVLNRNWESDNDVSIDTAGFKGYDFVEHVELYSDDIMASNTFENPDAIKPVVNQNTRCENGEVTATLKKLSWNMFRFEKKA